VTIHNCLSSSFTQRKPVSASFVVTIAILPHYCWHSWFAELLNN